MQLDLMQINIVRIMWMQQLFTYMSIFNARKGFHPNKAGQRQKLRIPRVL